MADKPASDGSAVHAEAPSPSTANTNENVLEKAISRQVDINANIEARWVP